MIHLHALALRSSGSIVAILICVVAAFAPVFLPLVPVILWLALQATLLGLGDRLATEYLDRRDEEIDAAHSKCWFIALEAARGLAWGALAGGAIATSQSATGQAFGFMILVSASALAATVAASIPASVVSAMIAMSTMVLLGLVAGGFDFGALPLAALAGCAQLCLARIASTFHATALETLAMQAEKDELIAELETAKATSDLARRRAEDANRAKSRFLAAMSHELRTPLNAILGFSEVMKGELFGAHSVTSYREYSHDIHASGEHLLVLINEILDLSRIEAGHFELKEIPVRLANVVEDCKHLLALRAERRRILIETIAETRLPPLRADERALRQIVLNLLTNAVTFTPADGVIRLKIGWTSRGGQYVSVHDSGPGFPEEEIPTILAPFGRGTSAQETSEAGTGLGLSIVKGLVELHDGSLLLRSKPHQGTEVVVIFPPERVLAKATEPSRRDTGRESASVGAHRG